MSGMEIEQMTPIVESRTTTAEEQQKARPVGRDRRNPDQDQDPETKKKQDARRQMLVVRKANSGTTIFASDTICSPSQKQIIQSVATVLHCQILEDELVDVQDPRRMLYPILNEEYYTGQPGPLPPPEPQHVVKFLDRMFTIGQFSIECCIISLVYINRLTAYTQLPLTGSNWKPVVTIAIVLAQKVWDDTCLANADFSLLYPALNKKAINYLEVTFLNIMNYKVQVSGSLYARYYFELRTLCDQKTGQQLNVKNLTEIQKKRLEARSSMFQKQSSRARKSSKKMTSASVELDRGGAPRSPYVGLAM